MWERFFPEDTAIWTPSIAVDVFTAVINIFSRWAGFLK